MIVAWIVRCEECDKWIDAMHDYYFTRSYDNKDICRDCFAKLEEDETISFDKIGGNYE